MEHLLHPSSLGFSLLLLVFGYTIYLVRSGRLSAHMAISWVIAEMVFIAMMLFDGMRFFVRSMLGEASAPYSLFLIGAVWIVLLMLESLTRISSLTVKLKEVNQQLALVQERLDHIDGKGR